MEREPPTIYEYIAAASVGRDAVAALWRDTHVDPPAPTKPVVSDWVNAPPPNPQRRLM